MSVILVEVAEGAAWVDRSFETASWWDRLVLTPGTYLMEPKTIRWQSVPDGERPYYGAVKVPATIVESYRVNRLFQHSSADHKTDLAEATVKTFDAYWYNVEAVLNGEREPETLLNVEGVTVRVVEEATA